MEVKTISYTLKAVWLKEKTGKERRSVEQSRSIFREKIGEKFKSIYTPEKKKSFFHTCAQFFRRVGWGIKMKKNPKLLSNK